MKESLYDRLDCWIAHCKATDMKITRLLIHPNDMIFLRRDQQENSTSLVTYRGYSIQSMKTTKYTSKKDKLKLNAVYASLVNNVNRPVTNYNYPGSRLYAL